MRWCAITNRHLARKIGEKGKGDRPDVPGGVKCAGALAPQKRTETRTTNKAAPGYQTYHLTVG